MLENEIFSINEFPFINEEFYALKASPRELDDLWANGWRHFGTQFYRYNLSFYEDRICRVLPLRIRLANFYFSKNKRRILKKNLDLQTVIRPIEINEEKEALFDRHKHRFERGVPISIYDFLSFEPATVPCEALEVCVYRDNELLAASFFDVGETAVSSVYAMFEPTETARSLGIFTMLLEIDFALKNNKDFFYIGYAYDGNSFYDYKKRFPALEAFDWFGHWSDFQEK